MNEKYKQITFVGIFTIICVIIGMLLIANYNNDVHKTQFQDSTKNISAKILNETILAQNISFKFQNSADYFIIDAQVPETPRNVLLYRGTLSDDDLKYHFKYRAPNRYDIKNSTPSKAEAPELAKKALEAYGGLPSDAVLSLVTISESVTELSSGVIVERHPVMTQVSYTRLINGMPVTGERDGISVGLGENGEVLIVLKRWRILEKTGEVVQVITPDKAVEKLKTGETYTKLQSPDNVRIDDVRLGYYEKPGNIQEIVLEPVWIFKNTNDPVFEFPVYARQFAGFTQAPAMISKTVAGKTTAVKDLFTVTFTDTSEANPTKWQWDFGDGTSSTEKNPIHQYKNVGTYNVTLTVWNELGSDTTIQQYTVTPT